MSGEGFKMFDVSTRKPLFYLLLDFSFWPAQQESNLRPTA